MKLRYSLVLTLCSMFFFQENPLHAQQPDEYSYLVSATDTIEVPNNQFAFLPLANNCDFSVKSLSDWITPQTVSKSSIAIFCLANTNNEARTGFIQLSSVDGSVKKKITVIQPGKNAENIIWGTPAYPSPIMGWTSCNINQSSINEDFIQKQALTLKNTGMQKAGYQLVNINGGFWNGRDQNGNLRFHSQRFPNGLGAVVTFIHNQNLKAGITTAAGRNICENDVNGIGVGLLGYDQKDCDYFIKTLGIDYLKVDFCDQDKELNEKERYTAISHALKNTGKNIHFNICRWAYPGTWVYNMANSWHTAKETKANWTSIKEIIQKNLYLSAYASEGRYHNLGLLEIGSALNAEEEKTHFGIWCMLNSPLIVGTDLTQLDATALSLLKNKDLIQLNQKAVSQQAYVAQKINDCYVLVKDINSEDKTQRALAVYNPTDHKEDVVVALDRLDLAGKTEVYDLFTHKHLADESGSMKISVPAHGVRIYALNAENRLERRVYEAESGYIASYQEIKDHQTVPNGIYVEDAACSGEMKVSGLGKSKENSLQWKQVESTEGGHYRLTFHYTADAKQSFTVEVNGTDLKTIEVEPTQGTPASVSVYAELQKGDNSIRLHNAANKMPDMDMMVVTPSESASLFVEAENFNVKGGWKVDQQFMDQMGSPYLNAHGMGIPVDNAATEIEMPASQNYHVYVRTYNWTSPWTSKEGPGKFRLQIDGKEMPATLGCTGNQWEWQYAGEVYMEQGKHALVLKDLTGFNGRVDAIYFNSERQAPPSDVAELGRFRRSQLNIPNTPEVQKEFDLVICGGGIAGMCAAMAAARQGMQVALINDRPVLGGNNSAEVRVHLGGRIEVPPYTNLGNLIKEFGHTKVGNAMPAENYEDDRKLEWIRSEKNISLFLSNRVNQVHVQGDQIDYVVSQNIETGERTLFKAPLFVDCTGDGTVGVLAGAEYRMGREAKAEFAESEAPETADKMTMGSSTQWYAVNTDRPSSFPVFEYGVEFNENNKEAVSKGDWDWENGMRQDQIEEYERIRDYGLMVVYSNWSFLKNKYSQKSQYANKKLQWVAYIGGKRESRRLVGDYILTGTDILNRKVQKDFTAGTSWSIDLHYPVPANEQNFKGEAFKSWAKHLTVYSYPVPYRCLYSRNVNNLFMAGRNISVSHMALGTTRVMRTTGMLGEVVGLAASVCHKHDALPRDVYELYFEELKKLMEKGAGKQGLPNNQHFNEGSWLTD